jgi:hypothetical protein
MPTQHQLNKVPFPMPKAIIGYCEHCKTETRFNHFDTASPGTDGENHEVFYNCVNEDKGCNVSWSIPVETARDIEIK